jgi:hypothetical protein
MTNSEAFASEVRALAKKSGLSYFLVVEGGATAFRNANHSRVVQNARNAHVKWEIDVKHEAAAGIDWEGEGDE